VPVFRQSEHYSFTEIFRVRYDFAGSQLLARYVLGTEAEEKWMTEPAEFPNRRAYEYVRSLLEERWRELRALEIRHQRMLGSSTDYLSCRRSLVQGIDELAAVLRMDPKARCQNGGQRPKRKPPEREVNDYAGKPRE